MPIKLESSVILRAKNDTASVQVSSDGKSIHIGSVSLNFDEVQDFADALVLAADKIRLANISGTTPIFPKPPIAEMA